MLYYCAAGCPRAKAAENLAFEIGCPIQFCQLSLKDTLQLREIQFDAGAQHKMSAKSDGLLADETVAFVVAGHAHAAANEVREVLLDGRA